MVSCYTLRKKIDEGGFGSVFQAIQNETRTNDTLEFLADPSPDARLRFEREARLLIRLRGPSIVQILDMNLRATNPYICAGILQPWFGRQMDFTSRIAA